MISSAVLFPTTTFAKWPFASEYENTDALPAPTYGGTLVIGTSNPPTIINPVLTKASVSSSLLGLIFDSLVRIDEKGQVQPGVAERWEVSEDGMEYTFHLKKGVRFHDGAELTAEDVKFTYDLISDPATGSHWRTNTEVIDRWEIIDRYTVKAILKNESPVVLYKLVREIAPKHLLQEGSLKENGFNYHPVGTGPFKFKEWNKDSNVIELAANENYFEGRPYLDHIVVKTFPGVSSLWSAFMRQEIDLVKFINYEDFEIVEKDPTFKAYRIPGKMYYAALYDLNDPVFSDKNIRQAIAYAVNIDEIINNVLEGMGVPSVGLFHPDLSIYNTSIKSIEYDPEKALTILSQQGWQDRDGDGILDKGKQILELKLLVNSTVDQRRKISSVLRQQLSQIGVKVSILFYENEDDPLSKLGQKDKPNAWLRLFVGFPVSEGYESVLSWYSLSSESNKFRSYKNKKVDYLFEEVMIVKNKDKRQELYAEINKIIYNDQPAMFLFYPTSLHAISARFQNTDAYFSPYMPTYSIKDWYTTEN